MNHAQRAMAIRAAQAASRGRQIALSPLLVAAKHRAEAMRQRAEAARGHQIELI